MDRREVEKNILNELTANEEYNEIFLKNLRDFSQFAAGLVVNEWSNRVDSVLEKMGNEALRAFFSATPGGFEYLSVPPMSYFKDTVIVDPEAWRLILCRFLNGSSTARSLGKRFSGHDQVLTKEAERIARLCIDQEKKSKSKSSLTIDEKNARLVQDISIILVIATHEARLVARGF